MFSPILAKLLIYFIIKTNRMQRETAKLDAEGLWRTRDSNGRPLSWKKTMHLWIEISKIVFGTIAEAVSGDK